MPATEDHVQPAVRAAQRSEPVWKRDRPAIAVLVLSLAAIAVLVPLYVRYSALIDEVRSRPFAGTASIYAAPRTLETGQEATLPEIAGELGRAGYTPAAGSPAGRYEADGDSLAIYPGPDSWFAAEPARIRFDKREVAEIVSLKDGRELDAYRLEPQLITGLEEDKREKRRLLRFGQIPKVLVDAVIATEDKRFFNHLGFDPFRIVKAAWVDLREGRKQQGASTLTMQLSRSLWLEPDKSWRRKLSELLITMLLEEKLTKEEIFEFYANQVYLGRRGSYSIHGFGEAAWTYFSKDAHDLTLPEAATLAGLIQRPGYFNPLRNQDRLAERRNLVLGLMHRNGLIGAEDHDAAVRSPLGLKPSAGDGNEAPYYVDLVNSEFNDRFPRRSEAGKIYTSLDLRLQKAAVEAIAAGMKKVDASLAKAKQTPGAAPQVALVALDPQTGEVKALAGGRDYLQSQLNRALAMRQPGSVFKPFVYAAAVNTAAARGPRVFTPASTIVDEPSVFTFAGQSYQPGNFHDAVYGTVTLRRALARSINIATVRLAGMVGYRNVVSIARAAGLNDRIQATPSVALGAYETTPVEMAGAYTVFANGGVWTRPSFIVGVRGRNGQPVYNHEPETRRVLDPAVNYLMVSMLEEAVRSGTGAAARQMGVTAPAAGKTGTSRDGWFAGFTSNLLCVVWVGFDDGRDLGLEGSKSALPVWAEFMKRALQIYPDAAEFRPPRGVSSARICSDTGELANEWCPNPRVEFFVRGTEPAEFCTLHPGYPVPAIRTVVSGTPGELENREVR